MKVTFYPEGNPQFEKQITSLVQCLLNERSIVCDEVILHFVDKKTISNLHLDFFKDPTPTDCISFPIDSKEDQSDYKILGEVFVCPEVAKEYCNEHGKNFNEEVTLYIIHGLLHLLGYDDVSEDDRKIMRIEEAKCLDILKKHQLILCQKCL